jgi:hypothetical protein
MIYKYKAIRVKQTSESPYIVLTSAPAKEILEWSGIPQKRELDGSETTGFQREFNYKRLKSLKSFFLDQNNVSQNAILCATRNSKRGKVYFINNEDTDSNISIGELVIDYENYENYSLKSLFTDLVESIEERTPELKNEVINSELLKNLRIKASEIHQEIEIDNNIENNIEYNKDDLDETSFEETLTIDNLHVREFWEEVKARQLILSELSNFEGDDFLGYSKDALVSFLKPSVVVDGQHRLQGALHADQDFRDDNFLEEIEERIRNGEDPVDVQRDVDIKYSRLLPVSLLMKDDPAEHVFQFVVVNQKATTMSPPLLGTIVSTSLSSDELDRVRERLDNSGIPLEESQAVSLLSNMDASPFKGKVQKGLKSDDRTVLAWSVLKSIILIFKDLKGGKLYHDPTLDFADLWRKDFLHNCEIVSLWEDKGYETPYAYWKSLQGPWLEVFIRFWSLVKERFASNDENAKNYWGSPYKSNIFNKPSLTILAVDFFQYIHEKDLLINNLDDINEHFNNWLDGLTPAYFNQDWDLRNVKKENPGTMKQWSHLWVTYRKARGKRPSNREYGKKYS